MLRTWSNEDSSTTDILLQCGDRTFYAHKDAICAHSQRLQDACSADTKVRELSIRIAHANEATDSISRAPQ